MTYLFHGLWIVALILLPTRSIADYPRLLDPETIAMGLVPIGSISESNPSLAEWKESAYRTMVLFEQGLVNEIVVKKDTPGNHIPPNFSLIHRFIPRNIFWEVAKRTSEINEGNIYRRSWEWEIEDKVVRLQVESYIKDNDSGDKGGDLLSMRWMVESHKAPR